MNVLEIVVREPFDAKSIDRMQTFMLRGTMDFKDDNRIQNDRLKSILDKLSPAQWSQDIGSGWSIGTMMCHLAFWDQLTSVRLRLWKEKGRLAVIPDEDNINSINDSLRFIFGAIDYEHGKALVQKSADEIDSLAQSLTPAQLAELESAGRDRWFKRSLHRSHHLERIERALAR